MYIAHAMSSFQMPEPVTRYGFISFSGSRFDYNSPAKCRRVVIQIAHYQCPLLCACLAIANYELLYLKKLGFLVQKYGHFPPRF